MSLTVEWESAARRALKKLQVDVAARVVEAVADLAATGRGDVKKLTDSRPPAYRLCVGDWRVIFGRDTAAGALLVHDVINRRDAYR